MDDIVTEHTDSILRVQLNRPKRLNAMTSAMYVALADIILLSQHIDALAKKYLGQDKYPYGQPGEVRLLAEIEPVSISGMG